MRQTESMRYLCLLLETFVFGGRALCAEPAPGIDAPWAEQGKVLALRVQTNAVRLHRTEQLDAQLRQRLALLNEPDPDALSRSVDENRALQARLTQLEQVFVRWQKTNSTVRTSIADLQEELANAEEARDRLVQRQSDLLIDEGSTNQGKGLRREIALNNLDPVVIKLVKNRVVPMMEPFYSVRKGKLKVALTGEEVDGIIISRVHDGEPAASSIRPGGLLDTLLSKYDPKQKYFRLLVCADSISAFHIVPQAIAERGFAYSWDTSNDEDIVRSTRRKVEDGPPDRGYLPWK